MYIPTSKLKKFLEEVQLRVACSQLKLGDPLGLPSINRLRNGYYYWYVFSFCTLAKLHSIAECEECKPGEILKTHKVNPTTPPSFNLHMYVAIITSWGSSGWESPLQLVRLTHNNTAA